MVQQTIQSQQLSRISLRTGACIQTRRMARQRLIRSMYQARLLLLVGPAIKHATSQANRILVVIESTFCVARVETHGRPSVLSTQNAVANALAHGMIFRIRPHLRHPTGSAPMATSMRIVDIGAFSQSQCESRGCCYAEHIGNGQKKCYPRSGSHPTPPPPPTPPPTYKDCARGNRYKDCGYWGITRQQCEARGCCYTENIGSMQKKCYPPA